jgi:hypothetical protein
MSKVSSFLPSRIFSLMVGIFILISSAGETKALDISGGGHLKIRGSSAWRSGNTIFEPVGTGAFLDGHTEFRANSRVYFLETLQLETSYEAVLSGGDTRRKSETLKSLIPALSSTGNILIEPISDRRRLMDLTKSLDEGKGQILYHRIDRLSLTYQPPWGAITIGRQVVTWGNGLLFNPMDLFNPFAPTDIDRDYKVGDDMVSARLGLGEKGDFQILYIPRRNPGTHRIGGDQYSLGGKVHLPWRELEFDVMGARHFSDAVIGAGATGYLFDAAWRVDVTWTFLEDNSRNSDYLSLVANLDYSWVWARKNIYGILEFYFNGLGERSYGSALSDPDVMERLDRGELFVLGKPYLVSFIQVEYHPLLNFFFTIINNVSDPSGILQPRAVWDIQENAQVTVGGEVSYGRKGTEFGGFTLPGTGQELEPANRVFLWLTYFF